MSQAFDESAEYVSEHFKALNCAGETIADKTFEACQFSDCDFSEATFKQCRFIDCEFSQCNLSVAKCAYSKFSDVSFNDCKLIGVDFTRISWPNIKLSAPISFYRCLLNDASFQGLSLPELIMQQCKVHDGDFREGDFTEANFSGTDFSYSLFNKTRLRGANFSDASHYTIDIFKNDIKGAQFSRDEALGLLDGLEIELVD